MKSAEAERYQRLLDDLKELRREYLSERDFDYRSEQQSILEYDKAMLTLSASALGFSMALISFLGKGAVGKYLIVAVWTFFLSAILSTIISLYLSHRAFRRDQLRVNRDYELRAKKTLTVYSGGTNDAEDQVFQPEILRNPAAQLTNFLNITSGIFLPSESFFCYSFASRMCYGAEERNS